MVYEADMSLERGSSLLEIIVCVGIIMLLLAGTIPKAVNMDKLYLKYEAIYLMNEIRYLQTWTHGLDYCSDTTYDFYSYRPRLVIESGEYYLYQKSRIYHDRRIGHGITIVTNRNNFQFNPRGISTAGTIRLRKNGFEQRIIIDIVGRARLEES